MRTLNRSTYLVWVSTFKPFVEVRDVFEIYQSLFGMIQAVYWQGLFKLLQKKIE